jgi:NAD(P)-dependent dehydrogenase (short-subunit alcohol dehydrogenase family)
VTPPRIVAAVVETWGRLDILVNNAAAIKHLPIEQATLEVFDEHMAVNVRSLFPHSGCFAIPATVGIGRSDQHLSSSGSLSIPAQCMYGTSAALEYQTRSLAAELAPFGGASQCHAPGPVDTPIHLTWAGDDVAGAYERMASEVRWDAWERPMSWPPGSFGWPAPKRPG